MWLHVFGRLKPGVTLAEAEARATPSAGQPRRFYGAAATGERRVEFLDQRLQISRASRGASSKRVGVCRKSLTALLAGVGVAAADRLRESRQPAARARRRAPRRDGAAAVARRRPRPPDRASWSPRASCSPASAAWPPLPVASRCTARWSGCSPKSDRSAFDDLRARSAGPGVRPGGDRRRRTALRRAAGVAGHEDRRRRRP